MHDVSTYEFRPRKQKQMYKHEVGAYDFPEKKETKATYVAWAEKETFIMPYIILAWWPFSRINVEPPVQDDNRAETFRFFPEEKWKRRGKWKWKWNFAKQKQK